MIRVENLRKLYGDFCAVDSINFEIRKGEITGLLGPNGAGKTTTMRMITGYLKKTEGEIFINHESIKGRELDVKKMIGYLPESAPLYGEMLVYDYLRYISEVHEISNADERIKEVAGLCGLKKVMHKNINELSKGFRQRVGLAHAIIHDPEILILDEPTTGLDPNQIVEIRNLIKDIGKSKTVILSTHILQEVEAACDRVIIINQGHIVADGTTNELKEKIDSSSVISVLLKNFNKQDIKSLEEIDSVHKIDVVDEKDGSTRLQIFGDSNRDLREDIYKNVKTTDSILLEMKQNENSLERVFRNLTGGDKSE